MTWDFVEQNTFSVVCPSKKLYFYPDLSIELKLQCIWKTLKLARSALSTSRPFLRGSVSGSGTGSLAAESPRPVPDPEPSL